MTQRDNIPKKVDEALNSLEGIRPASVQPYFYTRVIARLEKTRGAWENITSFISKPAMTLATVCVVILLNMAVIYKNYASSAKVSSAEQFEPALNDADDVASNSNTTLYNIWSQDNDQRTQK
jgi:hypothetical protein